jgi:DNA-binding CsgD family transcriptional regulator
VDQNGRTVWCTPQAGQLIEAVPGGDADAFTLPDEVIRWLHALPDALPDSGSPTAPIRVRIGGRAVQISYIGQVGAYEILLRLSTGEMRDEVQVLQKRLALTAREAEVLLWVGCGKSNREIAAILDVSHRTINKHLDQIYPKLGVENRTAAAAMVVRALDGR